MNRRTLLVVAPYVAWMALMLALPVSAGAYAVRTSVSAFLLVALLLHGRVRPVPSLAQLAIGLGVGVMVYWLWTVPESFAWYRRWCVIGSSAATGPSPYDPAVCGWPLTMVRLFGSAVVIAAAEELFFRSFLYRRLQRTDWTAVDPRRFDLSAFLWTVALFALEHDRIVVGAMAGAVYGFVYIRRGLGAAVVAHAVTNLALGLEVIRTGAWGYW